jgi:hypothetical protein
LPGDSQKALWDELAHLLESVIIGSTDAEHARRLAEEAAKRTEEEAGRGTTTGAPGQPEGAGAPRDKGRTEQERVGNAPVGRPHATGKQAGGTRANGDEVPTMQRDEEEGPAENPVPSGRVADILRVMLAEDITSPDKGKAQDYIAHRVKRGLDRRSLQHAWKKLRQEKWIATAGRGASAKTYLTPAGADQARRLPSRQGK